jgi:hypothetical protein
VEFWPGGAATGIGSLPFVDPLEALALVTTHLPDIPHWPQLPRRTRREHFVFQFLQPLVRFALLVHRADRWVFDADSETAAEALTRFYSVCLPAEEGDEACLQVFVPPPEAAAGFHAFLNRADGAVWPKSRFAKGQIAGPLTVGLELKDARGRPAYYHGDLRDVLVRTLALNARCQAAAFSERGFTPIVFVDDPAVRAFGSRLHLGLGREPILEDLNAIFAAIRSGGGIAGLHSCEAADWGLVLETGVRILSLDAFRFGASLIPYVDSLRKFLENGGVIAWGIVPTLDDPFVESADSLLQRLNRLWAELFANGPEMDLVLRQSMVTPACGAGLLTPEQALQIYRLTEAVSRRLRKDSAVPKLLP